MNTFGHFCLGLSWILACVGLLTGVTAGIKDSPAWIGTVRNATVLSGLLAFCSVLCLGILFLSGDFSNHYVWQFSNNEMASIYKFTAIWGGMDGSMLLWGAILGAVSAIVAFNAKSYPRKLTPWVLAVLCSSMIFFLGVTFFFTNPFRYIELPFTPPDGNGLNPLLQNPYMAIHPPLLYLGFTTLTVPYAFCLGAMLGRQTSNEWIRLTRFWTLLSWAFLTVGIVLGGYWAYIELGWGGYWAWDPVENASFLPWLTATAFLHSVMIQERKNMLKFWNLWLVVLSYVLTVFGTFLTRSGVVESVHAFASTDIGWVFLVYIGFVLTLTLYLSWTRRFDLRSERQIESFLSREAAFLANNLVFLSICFAVMWGVLYPVFSEALTGVKQAVGIPFYNAITVPLFILMLFLMGTGPLIAWRKARFAQLKQTFLFPFFIGVLFSLLIAWLGLGGFWGSLSYGLCAFVTVAIMGELHRGVRSQRLHDENIGVLGATERLLRRNRNRYGGHLVHLGVVLVTVAITASMGLKVEEEFSLASGERYEIGRYSLELEQIGEKFEKNYSALFSRVKVFDRGSGDTLGTLRPEFRRYKKNQETTSEVAILKTWSQDLYIVIAGFEQDKASFKVYINPLQSLLWFGVFVMLIGTVVVILPRVRVPMAAESAAESQEQA